MSSWNDPGGPAGQADSTVVKKNMCPPTSGLRGDAEDDGEDDEDDEEGDEDEDEDEDEAEGEDDDDDDTNHFSCFCFATLLRIP